MMDESTRRVDEQKVIYNESAEELFTLNIGCPHCKKTLSLSLAKLSLEPITQKPGGQNDNS